MSGNGGVNTLRFISQGASQDTNPQRLQAQRMFNRQIISTDGNVLMSGASGDGSFIDN